MKIIDDPRMPVANGHYSMCIEHNGTLYIAGQLPLLSDRSIPNSIEAQTSLVLQKLKTIVEAANSSVDRIIQVRIYLSDIEMWDKVNVEYAKFFRAHKPVRVVVPTTQLHYGCLIELEAIAAV